MHFSPELEAPRSRNNPVIPRRDSSNTFTSRLNSNMEYTHSEAEEMSENTNTNNHINQQSYSFASFLTPKAIYNGFSSLLGSNQPQARLPKTTLPIHHRNLNYPNEENTNVSNVKAISFRDYHQQRNEVLYGDKENSRDSGNVACENAREESKGFFTPAKENNKYNERMALGEISLERSAPREMAIENEQFHSPQVNLGLYDFAGGEREVLRTPKTTMPVRDVASLKLNERKCGDEEAGLNIRTPATVHSSNTPALGTDKLEKLKVQVSESVSEEFVGNVLSNVFDRITRSFSFLEDDNFIESSENIQQAPIDIVKDQRNLDENNSMALPILAENDEVHSREKENVSVHYHGQMRSKTENSGLPLKTPAAPNRRAPLPPHAVAMTQMLEFDHDTMRTPSSCEDGINRRKSASVSSVLSKSTTSSFSSVESKQLDFFKKMILSLQSELKEKSKILKSMDEDLHLLRSQPHVPDNVNNHNVCVLLNDEKEKLQEINAVLQSKLLKAEAKLLDLEHGNIEVQKTNAKEIQKLESELSSAANSLNDMQLIISQKDVAMDLLQLKLDETKPFKLQLEQVNIKLYNEITEKNNLKKEVTNSKGKIHALENSLVLKENEFEQIIMSLNEEHALSLSSKSTENDQLLADNAKLQQQLDEIKQIQLVDGQGQTETEELKNRIVELEAERANLALEKSRWNSERQQIKEDYERRLLQMQKQVEERNLSLKENKAYAAEIKKKFKELKEQAEKNVNELSERLEKSMKDNTKKTEDISKLTKEVTSISDAKEAIERKLKLVESKVEEARSTALIKTKELDVCLIRLQEKEESLSLLQLEKDQQRKSLDSELDEVKLEFSTLQKIYKEETTEMKLKIFDLNAKSERMEKENRELCEYVEHVENLMNQNSSKNG